MLDVLLDLVYELQQAAKPQGVVLQAAFGAKRSVGDHAECDEQRGYQQAHPHFVRIVLAQQGDVQRPALEHERVQQRFGQPIGRRQTDAKPDQVRIARSHVESMAGR